MNMNQKMLRSPIRWAGGKSRLRKHIVPLLPDHKCYVEPFCGASWVLFGKQPSKVEVINDIDQELVNFFQVIRDDKDRFISSFDLVLCSRAHFTHLVSLETSELSKLDRAHRFFYIIMAAWGGEFDYPRFATSITDAGHGNRLIGAIKNLERRIEPAYKRLQTVIIENLPWEDCVDRYDSDKTVFYLDPPYPQNGVNYAYNMRSWEDHKRLRDRLSATKALWILSSYDNNKTRSMYSDFNIRAIEAKSGMSTKGGKGRVTNREILVTNF